MTSRLEALLGVLVDQVLMSCALGNLPNSFILTQQSASFVPCNMDSHTQTGKMAGPISRLID